MVRGRHGVSGNTALKTSSVSFLRNFSRNEKQEEKMFNNLKKVKNDKLKISALNLKTRVSHKFVSFRNVCKRNLHAVGQWLRTAVVPQIPRVAAVAIMLICMTICAYADEKAGAGQIEGVGQTFKTSYMPAVKTLMNGIAACIAVVGAFSVYFKMQNGDQDVKKTIMMVVGGAIAFVVMGQALPLILG